MASSEDWRKTVRLNKLLGMWAAEKLGMTGPEAEAYSDALAVGTLDPERSDVLSKVRTLTLRAWFNRMSKSSAS
jgi:hypothetical protein